MNGGLVLVARAGFVIPNGKSDRSHRGTTLLSLLVAGAGGADVMLKGPGHWCVEAIRTLHIAAGMPSWIFFVLVKIA
jgi:hypothetical protein